MYTYYVYILRCSDNSFYTGITNNLNKRLEQHQSGLNKAAYTYRRRPVILVFHQQFNDVLQAIYFEKKIKGWSRPKKQALINNNWNMLRILAECRNATNYKYKPK